MEKHHQISYIEFRANDLEQVKKFYSTVFAWKFTDYGPDYTAFSDGSMNGGFTKEEIRGKSALPAGRQGPGLVILYSDKLETSLESVQKSGGLIVKPIFSFPGGRRFHFADPAGNELAVWSDK